MYIELDIINAYKKVKCQKEVTKIPKISDDNLKIITDLTNLFNTKWHNIRISDYMKCGMELWKGFSYSKFLDERILKKYIKNDKTIKRNSIGKEHIISSFKHLKENQYKTLKDYSTHRTEGIYTPIYDYIHNHIDKILMGYLLYNSIVKPNEIEMIYVDTLICNKNEMRGYIKTYTRLIKRLENGL